VNKEIVDIVIGAVALFLFLPKNKTDYNYALLIEIREQNNILREQTDLLKRVIQGQESQEIDLIVMSSYLKDIDLNVMNSYFLFERHRI
jgi:hypothetical protein